MVANTLEPVSISVEDPGSFRAEVSVASLGPAVQVSAFSYSPLLSRRTPALIRQGDPEQYQLGLVTRSPMWMSQRRNESGLVVGDMMLWDTSYPWEAGAPSGVGEMVRAVILQLPKSALPLPAGKVERLLAQRIPGERGMGAILSRFIGTLGAHAAECGPHELARLGTIALDLATACLAQHVDAYDALSGEVRDQALRERINAFIDDNLDSTELTPQAIASRHHISLRRLHLLFRGQPESVAASVRRRRLERCAAELVRPGGHARPVHAIAARWGFTNAAVFSRAFREAYGLTPTELRRQAGHSSCTHDQKTVRAMHTPGRGPALGS
ncbi:helix-turn-helix domain-containing protein [Streptomyces sp. NBC_01351]|uniref:AraC-like ligand-binding domain-containing protein n=1 Tax=Streptomyces sp. NBC_01351 TaxID=2903833 RepID=UPI002E2F55B6|nr:helix-turn-helix domain-containing protein [Streptomyces sp. NBC_01351]